MSEGPIFVGGLSRSGKTQLRQVLGAHPDISMTRRTYMWDRFYERFGNLHETRNLDRCLSAMLATEGVRKLNPNAERIRHEFLEGPCTYARLFDLFHRQYAESIGKRRWGDQLGFVERFADPIFAAFPSAQMIHMIRDPRSRAAQTTATSKGRRGRLGWETAKWLQSVKLAGRNRRMYADSYRIVRYEELASQPEETVRDLCAFLTETFDDSMAEALREISFDPATERQASRGGRADRAFVEARAGRELLALHYPLSHDKQDKELSSGFAERPLDSLTMLAWRLVGSGWRISHRARDLV